MEAGLRKPDIIAVKIQGAGIIDTQILPGAKSLSHIHIKKTRYGKDTEVQKQVTYLLNVEIKNIITTSCTIHHRGVWTKESHEDL